MKLAVKVSPRASRNALLGWQGEVLKLAVTAVPENGRANAAVQALLADALQLPKSAVQLLRGATQAQKVFEITRLDEAEVRQRLDRLLR